MNFTNWYKNSDAFGKPSTSNRTPDTPTTVTTPIYPKISGLKQIQANKRNAQMRRKVMIWTPSRLVDICIIFLLCMVVKNKVVSRCKLHIDTIVPDSEIIIKYILMHKCSVSGDTCLRIIP